ncbi:hypothetical protein V8G54_037450 [Vigna mungo]|uniref:Uncharacterized protein n=1 Tax=Vigna mungo TaxID=3915 RepID=A0AAQ3MIP6_VIGMU
MLDFEVRDECSQNDVLLSALCSAIIVFPTSCRVHYSNAVCLKNSMQQKTVSLMKSSSSPTLQFYATRTKCSFIVSNMISIPVNLVILLTYKLCCITKKVRKL